MTKKKNLSETFVCNGCNHELPNNFNVRTPDWCYLCDPNVTLEECLSDEPLITKTKTEDFLL